MFTRDLFEMPPSPSWSISAAAPRFMNGADPASIANKRNAEIHRGQRDCAARPLPSNKGHGERQKRSFPDADTLVIKCPQDNQESNRVESADFM